MSRFPDPDAEWTDDYGWTRYRGPQPYPCPADWVLGFVEGDGVGWKRFPGIGEGLASDHDVRDVFGGDYDEYEDARDCEATLTNEWDGGENTTHILAIDGDEVFRSLNPDQDDLWATVAEVLSRHSNGQAYDDLEPKSGEPTTEESAQATVERNQSENHGLGDFA